MIVDCFAPCEFHNITRETCLIDYIERRESLRRFYFFFPDR